MKTHSGLTVFLVIGFSWWPSARTAPALDVLMNQVGFEPNEPKTVRAQRSNDFASNGTFTVKKATDNSTVLSGTLTRQGGLWDKFYWQGDFTSLKAGGDYYVSGSVNGETGTSYTFTIGGDTALNQTGSLAFRYFLTQRCGVAVTDPYDGVFWHGICHLDDGIRSDTFAHVDAVGGWHDAGDYNKFPQGFAANGLFDLLWLYESNRAYYDALDLDHNSIPDILDECLHQARWLVKMVDANGHCFAGTRINRTGATFVRPESDTNNTICNCSNMSSCDACDDRWVDPGDENTPQETVCCAALIKMHRILASKGLPTENFAAKALSIWNHRAALATAGGHNNLGSSAHQIWAGLDLFAVFGQQDCNDRAVQCVVDLSSSDLSNPAHYDDIGFAEGPGYELGVLAWYARTYPAASQTPQARTAVAALMDHNINYLASGQIGLVRRNDSGALQYFPTNSDNNGFFLGINRLYLLLCWGAIESHKTLNNPAYLKFAIDQYDWVMGSNYNRVCMMDGAGDFNLPTYHTRYYRIPGHETGKQPGVVPNGYVRTFSTGLPQIDLSGTEPARYQTNEGWLINNAAYAMALSAMTVFRDDAQLVANSIPATMTAGLTYSVSITMKNTSYLTWNTADYKLGAVDDSDPFASSRQLISTVVAPGQNNTWTFNMTAPATTGTYTTDWRMVQENVNWFGPALVKQVQVVSAAPPAPVTQFSAVPALRQVTLSWHNPTTSSFSGTMIRVSTSASPSTPTDGVLVIDKANTPGSTDSTVHTGLISGTRYYYAAFAHNDVPAYSSATLAMGVPTFQSDFDSDGDVDQTDYSHLQICFSGSAFPPPAGCADADLDGNNTVDAADFAAFLGCMGGTNLPPAASCTH